MAMVISHPELHPCTCPGGAGPTRRPPGSARDVGRNRPHVPVTERPGRVRPSVFMVDLFRTNPTTNIGGDVAGGGEDPAAGGVGRLRQELSARQLIGFGIGVVLSGVSTMLTEVYEG